ncbi:MAG: FAD-dependent oxidoreductase [SAR324 cluster bacterium]|nr:FAD-dependent oxidoreductase [SAR324 cluster bacterium]
MRKFDLIVIGGGISGLSLAHYCAEAGLNSVVMEKDKRVGGALHSERIARDFWLELGAHTCYNSYGRLIDLLSGCGLAESVLPREKLRWAIWEDGRPQSIASRMHWFELLRSLPRMATMNRQGQSVAAYYSAVLGPRNFTQAVSPLLNAVVSQDAGVFPADLIFKKRPRRKAFQRSFTLPGGLQSLSDALASAGRFAVEKGSPARDLIYSRDRWQVTAGDGRRFMAPALAVATPPAAAARLLSGAVPELAKLLAGIEEQRFKSVGVVVRGAALSLPPLAGLAISDRELYSVVSRDVVPHPDLRGFAFHFRPGVGKKARMARITGLLGISEQNLEHVKDKTNVVPRLRVGHGELAAAMDHCLAGRRLALCGNYFGGMALEDCLARSEGEARRLAALL